MAPKVGKATNTYRWRLGKVSNDSAVREKITTISHFDEITSFKNIPCDSILEHDLKQLRPIARRSIESLLRRRAYTKNFTLYNYEINRLILHEMRRDEPE